MGSVLSDIGEDLRYRYEDKDMWLGSVFYYGIPSDFSVNVGEWMLEIQDTLIEDLIPNAPRMVDGFKRAVGGIGRRQIRVEGNVWRFMPRSAGHDEDKVYYNITVELLDTAGHVLSYDTAVEFVYDRKHLEISSTVRNEEYYLASSNVVRDEINSLIAQVHDAFARNVGRMGAVKVREMIRKYVERNMNGIPARLNGGLYFVVPEYTPQLEAIEKLVSRFAECEFGIIPLIRDDKRLALLRKSFEEESMSDTRKLIDALKKANEAPKVSLKRAKKLHKEFLRIQERLVSYSEYLESPMADAATALQVLHVQNLRLFEKVSRS